MSYEKIYEKSIRIFLLLFLLLFLSILISSVRAQIVSISPASQIKSLYSDDVATIDVYVSGITDLCGFQFDLSYNSNVLNMSYPNNVSEGPFLSNSGADQTDWTSPKLSSGLIYDTACVRLKENGYEGVNGSGVLATVVFDILKGVYPPGISYLSLSGIKLSDRDAQPISFTIANGTVTTLECLDGEVRPCTVCGQSGNRTCSGNVWGACNATTPPETCDGLDNDCDGFIDNTPGMGNYTLTQDCSLTYLGICAAGNETCSPGGWVGCPEPQTEVCNAIDEDCDGDNTECLGDITNSTGGDPDGCVDIFDLTFVSSKFGLTSGDAGWDAKADIIVSGEIDIYDLVAVARDFGSGPSC